MKKPIPLALSTGIGCTSCLCEGKVHPDPASTQGRRPRMRRQPALVAYSRFTRSGLTVFLPQAPDPDRILVLWQLFGKPPLYDVLRAGRVAG